MTKTLALVTWGLRIGNDQHAIDLGYDGWKQLLADLTKKMTDAVGRDQSDVYFLGGLFDMDRIEEELAEHVLKSLPGRKTLVVTDLYAQPEALLRGWHEVRPPFILSPWGQPILLSDVPATASDLVVHGQQTDEDTGQCVSASWARWGESFGPVNLYYLQTYAAEIGAGFIAG